MGECLFRRLVMGFDETQPLVNSLRHLSEQIGGDLCQECLTRGRQAIFCPARPVGYGLNGNLN